jgi:hypothetical protein
LPPKSAQPSALPPNATGDIDMPNVFIEPKGDKYQIEHADGKPAQGPYDTQKEAIDAAKSAGHHPLVARVRHLNDKQQPDQWRPA